MQGDGEDPFALGAAPSALPARTYALANAPDATAAFQATLGWSLGSYRFARYKNSAGAAKDAKPVALLAPAANAAAAEVARIASAVYLGRDLINLPANDLGPAELEAAAEALARAHGGSFSSIVGDALLTAPGGGYPLIHAVGRAATPDRAPRLLDLRWGREDAPRVTLVGKGVCFDTGGLDSACPVLLLSQRLLALTHTRHPFAVKPASNMVNMKKDMGGAATVLSLASMLMAANARIRLRVLIPAVENSVAGGAFRPGDVIRARSGLTVEIGNTDAEGRLVLADALTLADDDAPEVLIDVATLTGAHRVALGTELPGIFTDDEALASQLLAAGTEVGDPLWRLPLWKPYARMLDSKVADLNNVSSGPYGGAITAALFLRRFVAERSQRSGWVHVDENGWTATSRPGHPEGGEPQAARALYRALCARYGCDASKA